MAVTDAALFDQSMTHLGLLLTHYPHVVVVREGLRTSVDEPGAVRWCTVEFGPGLPIEAPPPFADHAWGSVAHAFFFREATAAVAFKIQWG